MKTRQASHERRNYYRILNVQPDAPFEIIKNNYRTLMQKLKLHPDLGGNVEQASIINEAYQVLSNTERRARYDDELLSEYGIETLSQGNLHQPGFANTVTPASKDEHGNQRNYYRLLNVQPDAPAQIIRSSYLAIKKKSDHKHIQLLNEAYSIIGNAEKRKLYDQLLSNHDHGQAVEYLFTSTRDNLTNINQAKQKKTHAAPLQGKLNSVYGNTTNATYRPIIMQYCQFCKTPHNQSPCEDTAPLCMECNSPLFPPSSAFMEQNRRDIVRLAQRNGECNAYLTWPGEVLRVSIGDLSPLGMQLHSSIRLDEQQIIKLDGEDFKAVGQVTHSRSEFEGDEFVKHVCGIKFLTVNFEKLKGQFFSANA
ncbi:MAG: DnaJ domain-containing protein [Pseudomonadota bacterium]